MDPFILNIPKAELHLHIEGTLEPEMMFRLAEKNCLSIPYRTVADVRKAYHFTDLQSFLDIYYEGAQLLVDERDFFELTRAYLSRAKKQNVRHAEIFFDPQTHTDRGISFQTVITGIRHALVEAEETDGITTRLIMCFLRDKSVSSAFKTLECALPFRSWITGVGLDSAEQGYPPKEFTSVFEAAREVGFLAVAHAGEEGPPEYIRQALDCLRALRIDHGVRCVEDHELVQRLIENQTPLTVCPMSNVKLRVFLDMKAHPLKQMLDAGLCVSVHSDDPAYFGGYVNENMQAVKKSLDLSNADVCRLVENSFKAAFMSETEREKHLAAVRKFANDLNIPKEGVAGKYLK